MNFTATTDIDSGPAIGAAMLGAEMTKASWDRLHYSAGDHVQTSEDLDLEELIPEDMDLVRSHFTKSQTVVLARSESMSLHLKWMPKSSLGVMAASDRPGLAKDLVESIMSRIPETVTDSESVGLWLWYLASHGPEEIFKKIKAPRWDEVSRNYTPVVANPLGELMKVERPENSGKIILWHGLPGTGKTSAIRTLMREWKDWCQFHYVADAEDLFKRPSYLMEVAASEENKWRLVIAEDIDGLLRPDADNSSGSGLGRLLNFSDGILGQGCNTIFLLTTNVQLDSLHPALTRPGRCLAQLEFTKFRRDEMIEWLPEGIAVPSGDKTLAELLDHVNKRQISTGLATTEYGNYL